MKRVGAILGCLEPGLGSVIPLGGISVSAAEVELNDEQLEVVEAPADARLLVIAGAGQGKTEVVVSRINSLIQNEDLVASEEILVLSFSRAAVSAVRTRLDLRDVAAANVRTFDSFASLLLLKAGIQPEGSFEARIRRATESLKDAEKAPEDVELLRHVVIDEVQDLVGDRADFVMAILEWLGDEAGITALGDPLQGVYNFVLEESRSKTSADDVFEALTNTFRCDVVGLGRNYRAKGKFPKQVVLLGDELRRTESGESAEELLEDLILDLPHRGEIEEWYDLVTPKKGKKTAVLCTTNADVLRVSRYFNQEGVAHAVRRQAQDFGAAKWIASALGPLPGPKERRSNVEAALERLLAGQDIEQKWRELKAAEGRTRDFDALDIFKMSRLVRARALPLPLTEPDLSSVIVSTIHRAKGLEFDSTYVVEPTRPPDDETYWDRVKRDYVALSRARDEILLCSLPSPKSSIYSDQRYYGRFKEQVYSRRKKGARWTRAFEFQYGDVESAYPTSSHSVTARQVQETLWSADLVGLSVTAELDEYQSDDDRPSYLLIAEDGQLVGRTSAAFDDAFVHYFRFLDAYPHVIDGLSLVSVESVAGDPRESEKAGLGGAGFWLVPRITGLARPDLSTT